MSQDSDRARRLAQNLVELLAPYEEELIALELVSPAVGPLRRAVGITIAEACYCISDQGRAGSHATPPADDEANQTR